MRAYLQRSFTLAIVLAFYTLSASGQSHTYLIDYRGRTIGKLYASQTESGGERNTLISSVTTLQLFKHYRVSTKIQNSYEGQLLLYSRTERITGSSGDNLSTVTKKKDGRYIITRKDGDAILNVSAIHYSVSDLYFREPAGVERVYSETHGRFLALAKTAKDIYMLTLPDGKQNYYYYSDGRLWLVEAVTALGKVSFRLEK